MFLRRSRQSCGPSGKPACLLFLATAFACLLLFLTAQPGQTTAQRPQGGLSLSPRIDPPRMLEEKTPPLRAELHKNFILLKTQAARAPAPGDVLPPECPFFKAPPRCGRTSLTAASLDRPHSRVTKLVARGPPARI